MGRVVLDGTVALVSSFRPLFRLSYKLIDFKQLANERDFAFSTRFLVMDMPTLDGSDGFNTVQGCLGRSQ